MNFENIPEELKKGALWCVWRYEERDGRRTKVPYDAKTGKRAQSNNRSTFSDYNTAVNAFRKYNYSGLGIGVFPPFAAIDIDHCVENGRFSDLAENICSMAGSYTELSPSGKGVRIILTVSQNFRYDKDAFYINNQREGLEVYVAGCTSKFVSITGNRISSAQIKNGDYALLSIAREYMTRPKALISNKPVQIPEHKHTTPADSLFGVGMEKDRRLKEYWNGNFPTDNESEKDAKLLSKLLYWCNGDIEEAIERFLSSPFVAGKDDAHKRKLDRSDYLLRTARNVMPNITAKEANHNYQQRKNAGQGTVNAPARAKQENSLADILKQLNPVSNYSWDDKGMGALFADIFKDKCRYNVTAREWYYFSGTVWQEDTGAMHVSQLAKELVNALTVYCSAIKDDTMRSEYLKHIARYGQLRRRETMIKDARDKYYISQEDLDKDLDLFNCQNGTYNLSTGEFKSHNPKDLLSKISNVVYDRNAKSTLFEKFVQDIMLGNSEKIAYLQTVLGYSLTAETCLETCWILYGATTRNGKSTLVETIAYLMGNTNGYALAMQPQTLANKSNKDTRQASGDIARLDGCRFLNASEPPKRMLFDVALLKTLLGRDSITARHLYEREYEFIPHFKLFINTNYLPLIQDDSLFSSGRINVITFDRHFSPEEQDTRLKEKLKTAENISGIFNWCLEGLKMFREHGAEPPEAVRNATADYRQSSDKVGNFIAECLRKTGKNSRAGDVYRRYAEWCDENGFGTENKGNFFDELKSKGIFSAAGTVNGETVKNIIRGYELEDRD